MNDQGVSLINQLVPLPDGQGSLLVVVKVITESGGSKRAQWLAVDEAAQSLGLTSRLFGRGRLPNGNNSQSFEFSAKPLAPSPGPSRPSSKPFPNLPRPMLPGGLAPGEKRISEEYRERSTGDVVLPLFYAGVSGAFIGLAAIPICVWFKWPWFVAPITWLAATAGTWFIASRDFLDDAKLVVRKDEHERTPPPQPVMVTPPSVNLEFDERNDRGKIVKQTRATLSAPASNPDGLWRYCQALATKPVGAFPSWEGGQSGPGAKQFGYMESELVHWRNECVRAGILEAPKQRNQPYIITERGHRAFKRIGEKKLEEASYGIS